jgi:hypothetical protein
MALAEPLRRDGKSTARAVHFNCKMPAVYSGPKRLTTESTGYLKDVRKSQMMPDQVALFDCDRSNFAASGKN